MRCGYHILSISRAGLPFNDGKYGWAIVYWYTHYYLPKLKSRIVIR